MSKLQEILSGWINVILENPEIEKIAIQRAKICSDCPFNINNKCDKCGCIISAKIRSEYSKCPILKW